MKVARTVKGKLFCLFFALTVYSAAYAEFPDSISDDTQTLIKVGEGTFRWTFFKVYEGALYLREEDTDKDVLSDIPKTLVLKYNLSLKPEDFRKSGTRFLEKHLSALEMEAIKPGLKEINEAYRAVEAGDQYSLEFNPENGTSLALNGNVLVTIPGTNFAKAYFSIWLGDNPVKRKFKRQLLER